MAIGDGVAAPTDDGVESVICGGVKSATNSGVESDDGRCGAGGNVAKSEEDEVPVSSDAGFLCEQ